MSNNAYPHSLEAERALLGSILIDNGVIHDIGSIVSDVDFYLEKHRKLFGRMIALSESDRPVDIVTIFQSFDAEQDAQSIGGLSYLSGLMDAVPLATNAERYAGIIRDEATKRRVLKAGKEVESGILDGTMDPSNAPIVIEMALGDAVISDLKWASEIAQSAWATMEPDGTDDVRLIPTGYRDLDLALGGGVRTTDLTIIAARPSMGKTAFTVGMLVNMADAGETVAKFSYETMASQIGIRAVQYISGVNPAEIVQEMNNGNGGDPRVAADLERFSKGCEHLYTLPLAVYDGKAQTVEEVSRLIKRVCRKHGVTVFALDYLQIMNLESEFVAGSSKADKIGHITKTLKSVAKEMKVAIVLLSQLNRELEKRDDKRPRMSDLRGSGEIEEHADVVLFLYREVVYELVRMNARLQPGEPEIEITDSEVSEELRRAAEVSVGKNRNGSGAGRNIRMKWFGEHQRYVNHSWRP